MDVVRIRFIPAFLILVFCSAPSWAIKWQSVSCADYASAVISTKGDLYVTGRNYQGVLGDGKDSVLPGYRKQWKKVATGISFVDLNSDHSLAITRKGKLLLTGNNDYGQLGTGTQKNRKLWTKSLTGVKAASVGYKSSLALKNDGTLWVTGISELGDRNSGGSFYGLRWQKTIDGVTAVSAGSHRAFAINSLGELLRITYPVSFTPPASPPEWEKIIDGVKNIESFTAVIGQIAVLKTDNTLWWAYDFSTPIFKQIASDIIHFKGSSQGLMMLSTTGSLSIVKYPSSETPLVIHEDVIAFCSGYQHVLVIRSDGSLWASGINNQGQFGFNNGKGTSSLTEWVKVKVQ